MDIETTRASLEAEYETLRAELLAVHQPRNAHERILVEEFIDATWDWKAARRVDREFWLYAGGHYSEGLSGIAQAQYQEKESRFRTHLRYRADCERSYYRALNALKQLSRDTKVTPVVTQPAPEPDSFTASASPSTPGDQPGTSGNVKARRIPASAARPSRRLVLVTPHHKNVPPCRPRASPGRTCRLLAA